MIKTTETGYCSTNLVNNNALSGILINGPTEVIKYLHNRKKILSMASELIMYLHVTANMTPEVVENMHTGPPQLTIVIKY